MKRLILFLLLILGLMFAGLLFAGPLQQKHKAVIAGITVAVSGCDGTSNILTGDTEEFEHALAEFCDDTRFSESDTDGIISTYSTNAGTLINTHSLEIDDDASGAHIDSFVSIDLGTGQDNDWTIGFFYKLENGPDAYASIEFISFTSIAPNASPILSRVGTVKIGGNNGTDGDGPFRFSVLNCSDPSGFLNNATYTDSTVYYIEIDVNAYTGAGDTSSIKIMNEAKTITYDSDTFEFATGTIRTIYFGGVQNDTDDHHYGIDDFKFKAAGGGF